ncbi:hypothetical protein KSS87_005848 [Heliosperma pusillum]|nr:hypothetical protein KSS87_005848 [Heliosperma pusillum]
MGKEIQTQAEPQSTQYTVEQLVALNPYNPDILADLENYVNDQVVNGSYSLEANLCLLRLYQFEPERMSTQALMAMPAPDFSLCLFLIPERVQMEEQFKSLIVLSHYLETARFKQFWEEAAKTRHIFEAVPGFEQAIQDYAVHILSVTYQLLPRTIVAEGFGLMSITIETGLLIRVVVESSNRPEEGGRKAHVRWLEGIVGYSEVAAGGIQWEMSRKERLCWSVWPVRAMK